MTPAALQTIPRFSSQIVLNQSVLVARPRHGEDFAAQVLTLEISLALLGQVIHDLPHEVYRWRQVMPVTLSAEVVGPDNPETVAAREIVGWKVRITSDTTDAKGQRHVTATVDGRSTAELTLDRDDRIVGGKCGCSYFYTGGLRKGPCRHLQAIRNKVLGLAEGGTTIESWYRRFAN